MNKLIWSIRVISFCAASLILGYFISNHDDHDHSGHHAAEYPAALKLESYDGKTWDSDKFAGKIRVINFWATWCPPCLHELPIFNHLAKANHGVAVFIGAVVGSPAKEVAEMVHRFRLAYPIAKVSAQEAERWGAEALPKTVILNESGKVVWEKQGPIKEKDLNQALEDIKEK